jgi:hypothetical protein
MRVGKTSLIYALALAVAWGKPFLGFPTTQGGVLVLAVEEHPHDVELRLRALGLQATDPVHVHLGRLENTVAVRIAMPVSSTPNSSCPTSDGTISNVTPVAASLTAARNSTFFRASMCRPLAPVICFAMADRG